MGPIGSNSSITLSKVYTWRTNDEVAVLQSCLLQDALPRHTNIIADKGFNIFNECAARCVNLSPQEEERSYSSWRNSKMYASGSIANLQRMLTETNEACARAKIGIWVETDTAKHLKAFRIVSSEMPISVRILC